MACIARSTPHRLVTLCSLVLLLLVALPETVSGKHRRPIVRNSLAGFSSGEGFSGAFPPPAFTCSWTEEAPFHDYLCAPTAGAPPEFQLAAQTVAEDPPDPPRLPHLLSRDRQYDLNGDGVGDGDIEGWDGFPPLAHPDSAKEFACAGDGFDAVNYQCSFVFFGHTHRFTVADIVSVGYLNDFDTEQWFVPCDLPPAPCIELPPPPPDTSITSGPSGTVRSRTATFGFASSLSSATFECRLDSGTWQRCDAPARYSDLSDGAHLFEVRAGDAGGNDPSPAERSWRVDATAPRLLLAGRVVRLSRRGIARLRIGCLGEQDETCTGRVVLTAARRASASQRRRVRIGRKRFAVEAGRMAVVRVKVSRRGRRVVARRGRLRVRAVVGARDPAGNLTVTGRRLLLLPPRD